MKISKYYFSIAVFFFLLVFCTIIFNNSLGVTTAIDNSVFVKKYSNNLFPQGWGFFTRNAREHLTKCFVKNGGVYEDFIIQCSDAKNVFGLDRACRAKHAEVDVLINQINDSLWKDTKYPEKDFNSILSHEEILDSVKNIFHKPKIFGEVLLVKEERIPWAWSSKRNTINPPIKYVKVFVSKH